MEELGFEPLCLVPKIDATLPPSSRKDDASDEHVRGPTVESGDSKLLSAELPGPPAHSHEGKVGSSWMFL